MKLAVAAATCLIVGPSFGLYQQHNERIELEKNGRWTKGIVVDAKTRKHKWKIKVSYTVAKKTFETTYQNEESKTFYVGDSIRVIYSSDLPKIYRLEYDWKDEGQ